jgi:hypothetical protein
MGSGFDNSIYWIISHVVTTILYYTFTIAVSLTQTIKTLKVNTSTAELPWTASSWRSLSNKSSHSQSHIATDGLSVSLGVEPIWGSWPDIYYRLTVTVLLLWGALFDEMTDLFAYAAGPCQHNLSRVRVPRDSRPYFTVSDLRLPFSSPPTNRRVTVEVFDPASIRVVFRTGFTASYIGSARNT